METLKDKNIAQAPEVLFFDVNETLLDLTTMKTSVASALGGREDLLTIWFSQLLHYSLVATVCDQYEDFTSIGMASLKMVAAANGLKLSEVQAREAVLPMLSLPAQKDVPDALERLKKAGFRLITLTNSSAKGVYQQMKHAQLLGLFEYCYSIDEIGMYKPHPHTYKWAARKSGTEINNCMLISAHGWDTAGALWAGMRSVFLSRPGQVQYPLGPIPEKSCPNLTLVADYLID